MPAKHKRRHRQQSPKQTSQQSSVNQQQPSTLTIAANAQQSKLQISSAQAEIYFEYLRKKITHQANDPFSLPFLNLKFEQLQSWKGATEQLNLESRIYGMRVDNCHDYTIKMLNFVIRNQEEQIGAVEEKAAPGSSTFLNAGEYHTNHSTSPVNFNSNLQKPQKLLTSIEQDKNLLNHSLWRVIFKKSQTLQKIQLNTLELSNNLCLQIDGKGLQQNVNSVEDNEQSDSLFAQTIMSSFAFASQKLAIFKEINSTKSQINRQIQQLVVYSQNRQKHKSIQQPLYFGYREVDLDGLYEEYDEFNKFQQHEQRVNDQKKDDFNLTLDNREDVFNNNRGQLYEIAIGHLNMMNSQLEGFQHEQIDDQPSIQGDLYEPHKDILFHSTLKKEKIPNRRNDGKVYGKRRKNHRTLIDFDNPALGINRKAVFRQQKEVTNNIQNDNLVPINYVVLYQNRNPFRKQRKIGRNSNRITFYDNLQTHQLVGCAEQENPRYHESFHQINITQSQQEPFLPNPPTDPFNHLSNMLQVQDPHLEKPYKNVSMKTVKNEIQKQIFNIDESAMNVTNKVTRMSNYSIFSNISDASGMDSYLEEEGARIGLKLLKQKMVNYDPLDILMSMLHVAYENQVLLEPVYASLSLQTANNNTNIKLQDIIIQGPNL